MSGKLDTATELEQAVYRKLNGGNFGSTSLDCIRAVLHASGLEDEGDRLRDRLSAMNECVRIYVNQRNAGTPIRLGWLEEEVDATDALLGSVAPSRKLS